MVFRKQQSYLYRELKHLREEFTSMNVDRGSTLDTISTHVKSIQHSNSMLPTNRDLEDLNNALKSSISAISDVSKEVAILRSLSFRSMEDRQAKIAEAHSTTFGWVFKSHMLPSNDVRSRIGLGKWLRSEGGVFWVSGKAGSGKSTLMKWLYNEPRTLAELREWAKGAELVTASFYFWNSGTDMQKSQQGLLQSLLYELLSKCAQLIPILCPSRWDSSTNPGSVRPSSPWSCTELITAFSRLSNAALANKNFCFFIDGLDEYDGDHFDLIEIMSNAVKVGYIKICLSSRPWNCFEDAFGQDLQRKLYLQDLTREDIEMYAQAKLTMPRYSQSTGKHKILYQQLIVDIGDRAQGVFLWVYLVVRSLRDGLADGDDVSMLQKRLQSLPTDLELYFKHILASVDPIHKEKVGSMFQVAIEANEPLLLMAYSFMDEDNPDFAISLPIHPMDPGEILDRQKLMRRRINGRSKGLLEAIASGDNPYPLWKVDFLHRTVRDFLRTKSIEAMLKEMAAPTFNANRALSRAILAAYKAKILDLSEQSWMERLTHFARQAEKHDNIADLAMMEQLEHVGKTQSHMFCSSHISFLVFTIEAGLLRFVTHQLDRQPELLISYGAHLLKAALHTRNFGAEIDLSPIVQMLLKRGINPNIQYDSQSLFIFWLKSFPYFETERWVKFHYWFRILKMMLLHGARAQDSATFFNNITKRVDELSDEAIPSQTIIDGIAILLNHGLDPNEPTAEGKTFWMEFLEDVCKNTCTKFVKSMAGLILLPIFTLFLHYGADPTLLHYSSRDFCLEIWPKGTSWGKSWSSCFILSKNEDKTNDFVELIEREKAYHKSQELSGSRKVSYHSPLKLKPTFSKKHKMAVRLVKS
jgi:hypothetical protein